MRTIASRCASWIQHNVEPVPNGWFPRRTTPEGKLYRKSPDGGNDPFGVVVIGWDQYDSYAYVGGTGTGKINPNPEG